MRRQFVFVSLFTALGALPPAALATKAPKPARLQLTSPAFANRETIPTRFTCDGKDLSPPLNFGNIPTGTKSLALIVDDPDAPAGTWVHWLVWNIPPRTRHLAESSLPPEAKQGVNDWRRNEYGGPCPPAGRHRYVFRLYALDTILLLPATANRNELDRAMKKHILGSGTLLGTYQR